MARDVSCTEYDGNGDGCVSASEASVADIELQEELITEAEHAMVQSCIRVCPPPTNTPEPTQCGIACLTPEPTRCDIGCETTEPTQCGIGDPTLVSSATRNPVMCPTHQPFHIAATVDREQVEVNFQRPDGPCFYQLQLVRSQGTIAESIEGPPIDAASSGLYKMRPVRSGNYKVGIVGHDSFFCGVNANEPDCSPHPFDIMAINALYQNVP